jgi:nucleoside 2-deoxyribosyltransferase
MDCQKKPKCFVAMAFDYADTDKIYDQHIEPVLKRNHVIPIIINRREDNRDINHQIIEQITNCDFCIADLTYTRPSVYYEAGYAQRKVEVIYTARADHLKKGQPEDQRVHFDLQMKPIIKWDNPDDTTFQFRLEKRLRNTVLRSWKKEFERSSKTKTEIEKFSSLPLSQRLESYRRIAINIAIRHNFNKWGLRKNPSFSYKDDSIFLKTYKNPSKLSTENAFFFGEKIEDGVLKLITITSIEKVLTDFFRHRIKGFLVYSYFYNYQMVKSEEDLKKIKRIEDHHIILSAYKTSESRIMSEMPNIHKDNIENRFYFDDKYKLNKYVKREIGITRDSTVFLYFPTGLDSETIVKEKMNNIISKI